MRIALSEAKAKLTSLVRRAESGEAVVITRNGKPVVRLVREKSWKQMTRKERSAALDAIIAAAPPPPQGGPTTREIQNRLDEDIWQSHGGR